MLRVDSVAKIVVIKRHDEYVEIVSRRLVALDPKSEEDSHKGKEILQISIRHIMRNYSAAEETNVKHATDILSTTNEETETNSHNNPKRTAE